VIDVFLKEDIQYPPVFFWINFDERKWIGKSLIRARNINYIWGRGLIVRLLQLCLNFEHVWRGKEANSRDTRSLNNWINESDNIWGLLYWRERRKYLKMPWTNLLNFHRREGYISWHWLDEDRLGWPGCTQFSYCAGQGFYRNQDHGTWCWLRIAPVSKH
jgi:hypothetical protein